MISKLKANPVLSTLDELAIITDQKINAMGLAMDKYKPVTIPLLLVFPLSKVKESILLVTQI